MRKLHSYLFFLTLIFIVPLSARAEMIDYPQIKLQALNKSTARTETFEAKVGDTIEYGSLFIRIQSCRKSEPLDKPENAAFLQIWEIPIGKAKSEWIFSGWMFSSSPAVSAMDHTVYDVWVLECFNPDEQPVEPVNKIIVNDEEFVEDFDIEEEDSIEPLEETEENFEEEMISEPEEITSEIIVDSLEYESAPEADYNTEIIEAEPLDTIINEVIADDTLMYE